MYQVYASVEVTDKDHERFGQVGTNLSASEPLTVKFADGETVEFELKQLKGL